MELSLIALNLFNQGTYGNTVYSGGGPYEQGVSVAR